MTFKILGITGLLLLMALSVFSMGKRPHDFDRNDCAICHVGETRAIAMETYGALTSKCMTCHTTLYDKGYMHPVDIRPKNVKVPLDFPLSPSGTITCATCHDIHSSPTTPTGAKSSFLRRHEQGKTFCDICHINSAKLKPGHEAVLREAHFDSKYIASDAGSAIDAMSRNCLTCHDGSLGSAVTVNAGAWRHTVNFMDHDNGGMHPIGMRYNEVVATNKKAALRPMELVDKRIRFFEDGKVGCGSCHDPYSSIPMKLVIEDTASRLCFACHKMDGK